MIFVKIISTFLKGLAIIGIICILIISAQYPKYLREEIQNKDRAIASKTIEISEKNDQIKALQKIINDRCIQRVILTAYTPRKTECDNDPLIAASMKKVRLGTIAVSRDLFQQGWIFGRKVYIENYGIYTINDLMHFKYSKHIDIFMWDAKKAKKFGIKNSVAYLIIDNKNL